MSYDIVEVHSRAEEFATSDKLVSAAVSAGSAVDLVVPSTSWGTQRKLSLAHIAPLGVRVRTYRQFLEGLWQLHGDGSALVTSAQRKAMLRPLVERVGLLDATVSVKFLAAISAFVEEVIAPGLQPSSALSASESKLMELVSLYERELELKGLVELAQVEARLDCAQLSQRVFVLEEPARGCAHQRRFCQCLGRHAQVSALVQTLPCADADRDDELGQLRSRLYTGVGGLRADGQLTVGEANGAHAVPQLLVDLVRRFIAQGAHNSDIAIVFPSATDVSPQVLEALAAADIPFTAQVPVAAARTGLGNALMELAEHERAADERVAYESLSDVLCGPYSGVHAEDARTVQARWRSLGGSTERERLEDITCGFASGTASSADVAAALQPMAELLAADGPKRVRLLFDHAHAAHLDADALSDDRTAAEVLLDFFEDAEALKVSYEVEDLGNVPVTLERSFGDGDDALVICSVDALGAAHMPYIIMADLDAEHYPMATRADVFDGLRAKLGIDMPDDTALIQRLRLVNLLEAADDGFACYRSLYDAEGEEQCQSALWDELMTVYRGADDEGEGLPVHEVPTALRGQLVRLSESEVFFGSGRAGVVQPDTCDVDRGMLHHDEAVDLLIRDAHGRYREFSPTQLEDYHRCPYLWFTSRRVGYRELDRSFDQSVLGTLFHDAMARFYPMLAEAGMPRVTPDNLDAAREVAERAFDEQVADNMARPAKGLFISTQADKMQLASLKRKMLEFVERDAHFLPGFVPTYFEVRLEGGDTPLEYATVPIRGAVDRIDVDAQGNAVVIDYKLSTLAKGYGLPREIGEDWVNARVQTDIYARLVEAYFALQGVHLNVVGSVYRSYSANMLRGVYEHGVAWGDAEETKSGNDALPRAGLEESYGDYLTRVERTVTADVQRLVSGDIAPNPIEADACRWCKARSFCPHKED